MYIVSKYPDMHVHVCICMYGMYVWYVCCVCCVYILCMYVMYVCMLIVVCSNFYDELARYNYNHNYNSLLCFRHEKVGHDY